MLRRVSLPVPRCHACVRLTLQTPHGDERHHQGGEGGLQAGHGAAGVALRREPSGGPPPLLPQREDHDHPVSPVTAGNHKNYASQQETVDHVRLLSGVCSPAPRDCGRSGVTDRWLELSLETDVLHRHVHVHL